MAKKPKLEGSLYEKAEVSPGFLFWKTFNSWNRLLRAELEKLGLTQAQYSILAATSYLGSTNDVVSQQSVATQLSMDKMMVSDVVKTLEKKKWLLRKPHPADARAFSLHLTSEAKQLLKQATPKVEEVDERFFGQLKREDLCKFASFLGQLG